MTSFDVNNFVTEDAGKLVGALGPLDEARKKIDRAARNRKSVELIFVDDKETVIERLRPCGS